MARFCSQLYTALAVEDCGLAASVCIVGAQNTMSWCFPSPYTLPKSSCGCRILSRLNAGSTINATKGELPTSLAPILLLHGLGVESLYIKNKAKQQTIETTFRGSLVGGIKIKLPCLQWGLMLYSRNCLLCPQHTAGPYVLGYLSKGVSFAFSWKAVTIQGSRKLSHEITVSDQWLAAQITCIPYLRRVKLNQMSRLLRLHL